MQGERRAKEKLCFFFLSRAAAQLGRSQSGARREKCKVKNKFFDFEVPSRSLIYQKLVQGERNTKQNAKLLFLFPSRSPTWAKPKWCKAREVQSEKQVFQLLQGTHSDANPHITSQALKRIKSTRRLENSAVLVEISKRRVNFSQKPEAHQASDFMPPNSPL